MKQRANMINAMNGKFGHVNYTRTYIFSTFGRPNSKTVSVTDGVTTEVWVYKTRMADKDTIFVKRSAKERCMKITMTNTIVTNVSYE
ncbi:MAG: hypothetical protein WC522_05135 [Candidatus Omnitrophota bacterium]